MNEVEWVESFVSRLREGLLRDRSGEVPVDVVSGHRLAYTSEVISYDASGAARPKSQGYETDLLVVDRQQDGAWTPRVVVECKLQKITTHDALTYSAKAATHKHVHPYLRYGILIGEQTVLPGRLMRHGAHFDFMASWATATASRLEWDDFVSLLADEVVASRRLEALLFGSRQRDRPKYRILHRPLRLTLADGAASVDEGSDEP